MISRGEVALIVASKGAALGLLGSAFLGPIIIVVVITTNYYTSLFEGGICTGHSSGTGTDCTGIRACKDNLRIQKERMIFLRDARRRPFCYN